MTQQPLKIFINYRRKDSHAMADRIRAYLEQKFGTQNVFQDVTRIPPGVDFRKFLRDQVEACDVLLVIIGQRWANITDEHGRKRLHNPADFVRIEVDYGLKHNKIVIPILVDDAPLPYPADLPPELEDVCYLNASKVRYDPDFPGDMERLINGIYEVRAYREKSALPIVAPRPTPAASSEPGGFNPWPLSEQEKPSPKIDFTAAILKILPEPFEWIQIPAGRVTLITEKGWRENYIPPGESRTFDVPTFRMAKYPVTVSQYKAFMTAGGYQKKEFWTGAGWQWREEKGYTQPRFWDDKDYQDFFKPDHPIIGVSWYESLAFCHWLNAQMGDSGQGKITLPTEQQWQRAAGGDDGRTYAWGNQLDEQYCNYNQNIGHTTPVIQYPKGASPYGVMDMTGNVWEWCLTEYDSGNNNINSSNVRVVRGGSWLFDEVNVRVAFRSRLDPDYRFNGLGFRVVRSY